MSGARKSLPACSRSRPPATRRATPPTCLSSGSGKVFIQSDVTNIPYLFAANPGWHAFFDQDPAMAEKARRKTYDMVVAEKLQVQGFHFPFPGLGNVEKDGNGYRVIPAPWNPVI